MTGISSSARADPISAYQQKAADAIGRCRRREEFLCDLSRQYSKRTLMMRDYSGSCCCMYHCCLRNPPKDLVITFLFATRTKSIKAYRNSPCDPWISVTPRPRRTILARGEYACDLYSEVGRSLRKNVWLSVTRMQAGQAGSRASVPRFPSSRVTPQSTAPLDAYAAPV